MRPGGCSRQTAAKPEAGSNHGKGQQGCQAVKRAERLLLAQGDVRAPHERQDEQRQRNHHRRGVGDGIPVAVKEIIQVCRVDGRIGVGGKRFGVLVNQPRDAALIDAERHDNDERRHERRAESDEHLLPALAVVHERHDRRRHAEESGHQRLRLDEHGQHVNRQRDGPFAADGEVHHQHQQQAEHAVNLAPCGAVEENRRIEGDEQAKDARLLRAEALFARDAVNQACGNQVARHRDELMHRRGRERQDIRERRVQPHDVHVCRRIVAEAR